VLQAVERGMDSRAGRVRTLPPRPGRPPPARGRYANVLVPVRARPDWAAGRHEDDPFAGVPWLLRSALAIGPIASIILSQCSLRRRPPWVTLTESVVSSIGSTASRSFSGWVVVFRTGCGRGRSQERDLSPDRPLVDCFVARYRRLPDTAAFVASARESTRELARHPARQEAPRGSRALRRREAHPVTA